MFDVKYMPLMILFLLLLSCPVPDNPPHENPENDKEQSTSLIVSVGTEQPVYTGTCEVSFIAEIRGMNSGSPKDAYLLIKDPDGNVTYSGKWAEEIPLAVSPLEYDFLGTLDETLNLGLSSPEGLYSVFLIITPANVFSPLRMVSASFFYAHEQGIAFSCPDVIRSAPESDGCAIYLAPGQAMQENSFTGHIILKRTNPDTTVNYCSMSGDTIIWCSDKTALMPYDAEEDGYLFFTLKEELFAAADDDGLYEFDCILEDAGGTALMTHTSTITLAQNPWSILFTLPAGLNNDPEDRLFLHIIDVFTMDLVVVSDISEAATLAEEIPEGRYVAAIQRINGELCEDIFSRAFSIDSETTEIDLTLPASSFSTKSRSDSMLYQRLSSRGFGGCDEASISLNAVVPSGQNWGRIFGKILERFEVNSDGEVKGSGSEIEDVINAQIDMIKHAGYSVSDFTNCSYARYELTVTYLGGDQISNVISLRGSVKNKETCEELFWDQVKNWDFNDAGLALYYKLTHHMGYSSLTERITNELKMQPGNLPSSGYYTYETPKYHPVSAVCGKLNCMYTPERYNAGETITVMITYKESNDLPVASFNPQVRIVYAPTHAELDNRNGGSGKTIELMTDENGQAVFDVKTHPYDPPEDITLEIFKASSCGGKLIKEEIVIPGNLYELIINPGDEVLSPEFETNVSFGIIDHVNYTYVKNNTINISVSGPGSFPTGSVTTDSTYGIAEATFTAGTTEGLAVVSARTEVSYTGNDGRSKTVELYKETTIEVKKLPVQEWQGTLSMDLSDREPVDVNRMDMDVILSINFEYDPNVKDPDIGDNPNINGTASVTVQPHPEDGQQWEGAGCIHTPYWDEVTATPVTLGIKGIGFEGGLMFGFFYSGGTPLIGPTILSAKDCEEVVCESYTDTYWDERVYTFNPAFCPGEDNCDYGDGYFMFTFFDGWPTTINESGAASLGAIEYVYGSFTLSLARID